MTGQENDQEADDGKVKNMTLNGKGWQEKQK